MLQVAWTCFFRAYPQEYIAYEISIKHWAMTTFLVAMLTPLREFVRILEATNSCTLNLVIAFTMTLKDSYDAIAEYEVVDPQNPDDVDNSEYLSAMEMDGKLGGDNQDFRDCQEEIRREVSMRFFKAPSRNKAAHDVLIVAAFLDVSYRVSDF